MVPPSGGNERGGTGCEESELTDSTEEFGEPTPGDPEEGSSESSYGAS